MPTENRSSNTEQMVSVPRETVSQAAELLQEYNKCSIARELRALLAKTAEVTGNDVLRWMDEHAAAQHQATPLGWVHGGGQEFTACPDHAHDLRAEGIDLTPAYSRAQHQDEPVAWRGINELGEVVTEWIDGVPPERMVDLRGNPGSFAKIELAYSHVDAGEVERLHNGHVKSLEALNQQSEKQRDHWIDECKTLRAQLAERDALLRDLVSMDIPRTAAAIERAKQILSASAEPNQCDGCQAGIPLVNGAHRMGKPGGYADTMSCQAGKYAIAESSAPVERDEREAFQREGRYIVIKLVDLAKVPSAVGEPFAEQLTAIQRRLPSRQYVVVESDWPEYEPTWAAIQARAALERKP